MRKTIILGALAALIGLGAVAQVNAQANEPANEPAKPALQDKGVITGPDGQPAARGRGEAREDRDGERHHREARREHRHGDKHERHGDRDYAYRGHHADRDSDDDRGAGQDRR